MTVAATRAATATGLALAIAAAGAGCARMIPVAPEQLPALAGYKASGTAQIRSGDREVLVERRYEPTLAVRPQCTVWQSSVSRRLCDGTGLHAPLNEIELTGDRLVFPAMQVAERDVTGVSRAPDGRHVIELAHVRDGMLRMSGYRLPGWRPKWGAGVSLLGPAMSASFTGQYRPLSWLALDVGLLPAFEPTAWTGVRGLFPPLGPVRPFVGASIFTELRSPTRDPSWLGLASGRIGVDVELGSEQDLVTVELDLMRRLERGPDYLYCSSGDRVCPYGGLAYSHVW
jgi:hypothetical protein